MHGDAAGERCPARTLPALLILFVLAAGCRPVSVKPVSTAEAFRAREAGALASDQLSSQAERVLDHYTARIGDPRDDADAAFAAARDLAAADSELAAALAEMAVLVGREAERIKDIERARGYALLAAATAWDGLLARLAEPERPAIDPDAVRLMQLYDRGVADFVASLPATPALAGFEGIEVAGCRFELAPRAGTPAASGFELDQFDRVFPAVTLRIEGVRHRHQRDGFGVPVAAVRENHGDAPLEAFLLPEGIIYPATMVLAFEPGCGTVAGEAEPGKAEPGSGVRRLRIDLVDSMARERFEVGDLQLPLAADFTAPYALLLSRTRLRLQGVAGAVRPKLVSDRRGVFMLEPYAPDKIPLLMVHGLLSSPAAFVDVSNDVWGDPQLRTRYQVWHYMYPTGMPFPWAARDLRQGLDSLRALVDPEGDDAAWQDMVVIAHSMGGLLVRLLIADSSETMWNGSFRLPLDEMQLDDEKKQLLREIFYFERRPYISRVVFMATPHRGAVRARGPLGKLANALIKLPLEVRDLFASILDTDHDAVTPELAESLGHGVPSSIHSLRPESLSIRALAELPPHAGVSYHTIVGDRGLGGGDSATDGYVTLKSAHLDGAASELIVPTGHSVYEHRKTLAELRRILNAHVEK